ncbi:glycerophosphodiester phosphodiesterase family protein [Chitinophaga lutea]
MNRFLLIIFACTAFTTPANHAIRTPDARALKAFLHYSEDRIPLVSAHRGGPRKDYPENCLATFANTLQHTPALLEIDPRYTKDSAIVLMHDPTLDRTTNGHGKVSDFTLAELRKLRLKDTEGRVTEHTIPTLDEALEWARGKTILVIDAKDVPIRARAAKVLAHKAQGHAVIIAYSMEDILACHALSSDLVMEVMAGKREQIEALDKSGVPWENMIGFVSHEPAPDTALIHALHRRGAMAILGSSRHADREYTANKIDAAALHQRYTAMIGKGCDIIEADLGIECGDSLRPLQQRSSSKRQFIR